MVGGVGCGKLGWSGGCQARLAPIVQGPSAWLRFSGQWEWEMLDQDLGLRGQSPRLPVIVVTQAVGRASCPVSTELRLLYWGSSRGWMPLSHKLLCRQRHCHGGP
jgi:hypothetical protein